MGTLNFKFENASRVQSFAKYFWVMKQNFWPEKGCLCTHARLDHFPGNTIDVIISSQTKSTVTNINRGSPKIKQQLIQSKQQNCHLSQLTFDNKIYMAKLNKTCHRDRIARLTKPCPSPKKLKCKNFNILLMPPTPTPMPTPGVV